MYEICFLVAFFIVLQYQIYRFGKEIDAIKHMTDDLYTQFDIYVRKNIKKNSDIESVIEYIREDIKRLEQRMDGVKNASEEKYKR